MSSIDETPPNFADSFEGATVLEDPFEGAAGRVRADQRSSEAYLRYVETAGGSTCPRCGGIDGRSRWLVRFGGQQQPEDLAFRGTEREESSAQ